MRELAARTGINFSHLGRIENGHRPPTAVIADACDRVFPERNGWFREYYEDSKSAIPPGLRSWAEHEDKARRLSLWAPGIIHGLLQTEEYARVFLDTLPGVDAEVIAARLASRLARQRRVLFRDDPPAVKCVIDHAALYRLVGSPDVMAGQMGHLLKLAALPYVTLQVLPAVAHAATASELIIADNSAAYCEHLAAGGVYSDPDMVARLELVFTTIMSECYRASDSVVVMNKAEETWTSETTGGRAPTAAKTGRVSKSVRPARS